MYIAFITFLSIVLFRKSHNAYFRRTSFGENHTDDGKNDAYSYIGPPVDYIHGGNYGGDRVYVDPSYANGDEEHKGRNDEKDNKVGDINYADNYDGGIDNDDNEGKGYKTQGYDYNYDGYNDKGDNDETNNGQKDGRDNYKRRSNVRKSNRYKHGNKDANHVKTDTVTKHSEEINNNRKYEHEYKNIISKDKNNKNIGHDITKSYERANEEDYSADINEEAHRRAEETGPYFKWLHTDFHFDFIVGIAVGNHSVGVGAFFGEDLVLTSSNPIQDYIDKPNSIGVYGINGTYNNSIKYDILCVTPPYYLSRRPYWIYQGNNELNSPIYDLVVIHLKVANKDLNLAPTLNNRNKNRPPASRFPFRVDLIGANGIIIAKDLGFAGFGYTNKEHVKESLQLRFEFYPNPVLLDCDEYIPRTWGKFICLMNIDDYAGIQSGAPLLRAGKIIGIGCFSMKKGTENIFVFTDLRPYSSYMGYCNGTDINDHYFIPTEKYNRIRRHN